MYGSSLTPTPCRPCSAPWGSCSQKLADKDAEIAQLRAERDAALRGEYSDTSGEAEERDELDEDDEDADMGSAPPTKVDRRRARAMAKAEATSARLRQLEEPRVAAARDPSAPSSEDDDAMWDYMDVDVALPPRLADLDTPTGR